MARLRTLAKEIRKNCRVETLADESLQSFISSVRLLEPFPKNVKVIWEDIDFKEGLMIDIKLTRRHEAREAKKLGVSRSNSR